MAGKGAAFPGGRGGSVNDRFPGNKQRPAGKVKGTAKSTKGSKKRK